MVVEQFDIIMPFVYSTVATIVTVAGAMWRIVEWQNAREEKKNLARKEYADRLHMDVVNALADMNVKITGMVEDLRKRADLTNGNVSFIRADIADLQEDMLDLWESAANHDIMPNSNRDKKLKALERRKRRRKIESDRIAQQER